MSAWIHRLAGSGCASSLHFFFMHFPSPFQCVQKEPIQTCISPELFRVLNRAQAIGRAPTMTWSAQNRPRSMR